MGLKIDKIRADFPILGTEVYGRPLVYFDNAATTQKPRCVLDKMVEVYEEYNANVHRGVHHLSQRASMAHEEARRTIANFIGAEHVEEIIFTRGTTESINVLARSFGELLDDGDEVVITEMEHHANIVPWQLLQKRKKIILKVLRMNAQGELKLEELPELITSRTRLMSLTMVSNALGTINPVKEVVKICRAHQVKVLLDVAQSIAHIPLNVQELDVDFVAFSGHKIYAPVGIGVLYGKKDILELMPPCEGGGGMIEKVSFDGTTFNDLPYKFEAGTPDFTGAIALAEAINYLCSLGQDEVKQYEDDLLAYALEKLRSIPDIRFIGEPQSRSSLVSFLVGDIHPFDIGALLDKLGVAIRTGHHCAHPVMDAFGITGTLRASFAFYNTKEEIDYFHQSLLRVLAMLSP